MFDQRFTYIVAVTLSLGTRYYGPFNSEARAEHWAKNNWMDYEIVTLYGTG